MSNGVLFFDIAAIGYIAASLGLLTGRIVDQDWVRNAGTGLLAAAFLAHALFLSGVARNVNRHQALIDNIGAQPKQIVQGAMHQLLIAGNSCG